MAYWVALADDDSSNLSSTEHILTQGGFAVSCFSSGSELLDYVEGGNKPDLILYEMYMNDLGGTEFIRKLRMFMNGGDIPVIILSTDDDPETEAEALSVGAIDYIVKPFAASVLQIRIGNAVELMHLQLNLQSEVNRMTAEIVAEHQKFERLSLQIVKTLAGTIDAKDSFTNGHSLRVADYSREIARRAGFSQKRQDEIYMVGLLHDVGKIGVPDSVINKPSRLTDEEFAMIKKHPALGYDILKNIVEMPKLAVGARWHHERYDGKGYPDGLTGISIPEEARIIGVADAYDAMSSNRSFHTVLDQEYILNEINRGKGVQFDPRFADIMISMIEEDKDYSMKEHKQEESHTESAPIEIVNQDSDLREKAGVLFRMLESCGISTETGMKYCMNDVNFYIEMLNEFTAGNPERVSNLTRSFEAEDWNKYRLAAHAIRSVSRSLGASELSESAKKSEEAAKRVDIAFVRENHSSLINALNTLSENVAAVAEYIT